jgi:hypothetical protein
VTIEQQPARITELLDEHIPAARKSPVAPSPVARAPAQATAAEPTALHAIFQCQIAIWTVADLLVLADAPRLDNSQMTLLRNILQAIGRGEALSDTRQFSWPLPQRKDKSVLAAKEHFQGLLDGGLLQTSGLRQILCFGDAITTLLSTGETPTGNLQQYGDWPIINACALHEMLAEPAKKAGTWRSLQVLVRS